jgi:hypothetical protein
MFNNTLQVIMKNAMLANMELQPELTVSQRLAEVELEKEVPDFKELIANIANITAKIMRNSIIMEQALSTSESSVEELTLVSQVMAGTVDRSLYVNPELVEIIEANERFGIELAQPMVDKYGDRAQIVIVEKFTEHGVFGEFTKAVIDAIEAINPSQADLESLSRVWTKDNVAQFLPKLSEQFNAGWDMAEADDSTKH